MTRSWFDKLTMSGCLSSHAAYPLILSSSKDGRVEITS
jgi:hypothetical protein